MRFTSIFIPFILMAACSPGGSSTAESVETEPSAPVNEAPSPSVEPLQNRIESEATRTEDNVEFEDILDQYRALNSRLEGISYRIQKSNAELCSKRMRSPGFTVHNVYDYPENLRRVAEELLPVSDRLSLRTIKAGSPADRAGLLPGDNIVELSGRYFPSGRTSKAFYEASTPAIFERNAFDMKVSRGEDTQQVTIIPETLCGYPVNLFFSERINGHTDGKEVWITSELLRSRPVDVDVALVIAHEMAHATAGHMEESPTKALELIADKMALIMLARAGFDYERAVANWQNAPRMPHDALSENSATHPTTDERLENFKDTVALIKARQKTGKRLEFN